MTRIFFRGLLLLGPLWIASIVFLGVASSILNFTGPVVEVIVPGHSSEWWSRMAQGIGVLVFVFAVGALMHLEPLRNLTRKILCRIPLIGPVLVGYFKLEDSLHEGGANFPVVLLSDDEGYSYIGVKTGEAEGKAIVYCPGFPVVSGSVVLAPPERISPTSLTFAEAMEIFTTLGLKRLS